MSAVAELTVNEALRDANVRHQIGLTRYSNGLVAKVMALLNRSDTELFTALTTALQTMDAKSFAVQRLETLLSGVRALNVRVYAKVQEAVGLGLRDLTHHELGFQSELLARIPPIRLPLTAIPTEHAFAAVLARPFQGRLLREWGASMEAGRMVRVRDALRMGFVQQQTLDQIVGRIRGTRAKGYADGIIHTDRRAAESVVRTAVAHTAAVARSMLFEANTDIVKAVQWVSTLDDRTSPICQQRDGLTYTCDAHIGIGHDVPWMGGPGMAHWNCRSCSSPVLKSMAELGLDAPDLPRAKRASMDGAVPGDTTYAEWFAGQSAAVQDRIVGPTRGQLFRKGGIGFDRFANDKGRLFTLAELRASDAHL